MTQKSPGHREVLSECRERLNKFRNYTAIVILYPVKIRILLTETEHNSQKNRRFCQSSYWLLYKLGISYMLGTVRDPITGVLAKLG